MAKLNICEASDAVTSMQALRNVLREDLDDIERRIHELAQSGLATSEVGVSEMNIYCIARAALYSGLAGINEVLGWVHLMADKDSDGNAPEIVRSFHTVPAASIH
ncbi:hypothetical protein [Noviherbaspirillum galbum]|uniref:Uncharacterized protein n=1 Tax=Noviherbaspirillum galbum TaxID=2709383 RepID=A0A6B3SUT2_9BURK|nr:hypothetical protein [Noviherbaspirillum galbum]NEX63135.1 hypothetical protein [Noviherbaspirillum galbum]